MHCLLQQCVYGTPGYQIMVLRIDFTVVGVSWLRPLGSFVHRAAASASKSSTAQAEWVLAEISWGARWTEGVHGAVRGAFFIPAMRATTAGWAYFGLRVGLASEGFHLCSLPNHRHKSVRFLGN